MTTRCEPVARTHIAWPTFLPTALTNAAICNLQSAICNLQLLAGGQRMANQQHLDILKRGVAEWNRWRVANPDVVPDLCEANLQRADLTGANLQRADLTGANLQRADLTGADLTWANLQRADLTWADLTGANLQETDLRGADLQGALLGGTIFGDTDLSGVQGLDTVVHRGPSTIGIDTLYKSRGNIPEAFLRGCGVPDSFIEYIPSLIGAIQPIQFYSCFISYSTRDNDFARRLHERMRAEHLRVWFAPEDMPGGTKLHEEIERAIQLHDRLLLILSEHSIESPWVRTEIRKARQAELKEQRRKLFPIALVSFERLRTWQSFYADTGEDLAEEVREYFIPDFSNWKEHDAFESAFARLLRDLRAAERTPLARGTQ
jgi:uncharacterized protein YjbI with pentapeptide repeats